MARSVSVFTSDQCEDLDFELDSQYEQLLPILEKAVAAHRANQDLPSLEDTVRAHVETAEKLAAPCRRFLRDLEKGSSHKCMHDSGMISPITRRPKDEE